MTYGKQVSLHLLLLLSNMHYTCITHKKLMTAGFHNQFIKQLCMLKAVQI